MNMSASESFARRSRRIWLTALCVCLIVVGTFVCLGAQGGPQPAFGQLVPSPLNFVFKTPTTVTFTIRIDTPTLNPTTVDLQRVDANGRLLAVVGRMNDNGHDGDVRGGDKIFTKKVVVNEATIGRLYFRVAAAFRGNMPNAASAPILIDVWNATTSSSFAISIPYPPTWTAAPARLSSDPSGLNAMYFSPADSESLGEGITSIRTASTTLAGVLSKLAAASTILSQEVKEYARQWTIVTYVSARTGEKFISALTQDGNDTITLNADFSTSTQTTLTAMLPMVR